MSNYRTILVVAAAAVLAIVAASLASAQYSFSRAALPTLAPSAQVPAEIASPTVPPTQAPTKTIFVFPTPADSTTATPASATPVEPTPMPSATASAEPSSTLNRPTSTPFSLPPSEPAEDDTATPLAESNSGASALAYTVAISDVFGRREPELDSDLYRPLERGQSYTLTAQSPDGIWLQVELPRGQEAVWVPAAYGLISGNRAAVPLAGPTLTPASIPPSPTPDLNRPATPYISLDSARVRDIFHYGQLLGNNPRAFIKIGDCQAKYPFFLSAFDKKSYRLGTTYAYLQATITQFAGSFGRDSAAAQTGFGTATVLDPTWANPEMCRPGESPLVCEYRAMRPSLAIISLGTNDIWQPDGRHEKNMRQIIDYLLRRGVVPVLSTKADNVEGDGSFNRLMVQLATDYRLPLWDFWQVTRSLPENGLVDTYHLSWGPAVFDDPKNLLLGWPWRNLTALQALDAVWRAVR